MTRETNTCEHSILCQGTLLEMKCRSLYDIYLLCKSIIMVSEIKRGSGGWGVGGRWGLDIQGRSFAIFTRKTHFVTPFQNGRIGRISVL